MSSDPPAFRFLTKVRRSRLIDLREKVTPVLSNRIHTHFTDHCVAHSVRVATFRAGYDGDAAPASRVAMKLLPPGPAKELFEAELAEARLLVGDDLRHPEGEE